MNEKKGLSKFLFSYGIEVAIILACIAYLTLGFANIVVKEASIQEIIANCALVFIFGITINQLFAKKGICSGQQDDNFIATKKLLGDTVGRVMPIVDKLEPFLDELNKKELKMRQEHLLLLIPETYDNYVNCRIDYEKLDKRSKKIFDKVSKIKIKRITVKDITSELDTETTKGNLLGKSKRTFEKEQKFRDVIGRVIPVVLFGYFTFRLVNDLSIAGFIWSIVQVVFFLTSGMLKYWVCYTFITDEFRNRLIVKNNILEEFYIEMSNKKEQDNVIKGEEDNVQQRL